jgi:hypothetical protein
MFAGMASVACRCGGSDFGKGVAGPDGRRWLLFKCSVRMTGLFGGCHLGRGIDCSFGRVAVFGSELSSDSCGKTVDAVFMMRSVIVGAMDCMYPFSIISLL